MAEPRLRVLFLCTGNSARSQMAETILRHLSDGRIQVESAGTVPRPDVHPMARRAVKTLVGLDMAGQHPKLLDEDVLRRGFDYVITVCDHAAETCPVFSGRTETLHWSFEDPAANQGSDDEKQRAFDATAGELLSRLNLWLGSPAVRQQLKFE